MGVIESTVNEQGPPGAPGPPGTSPDNRSIANDATEDFGLVPAIYIFFGATQIRKKAEILFDGTVADIVALNDEGSNTYNDTEDNAGTINIFVTGGSLMVQNKTGAAFSLSTRRLI